MAKVIRKKSELIANRNRTVFAKYLGYTLCPLCGVLAIELGFADFPAAIVWIMSLASFVGLFLIHTTRGMVGIKDAGVQGELKALSILESGLPDDTYYCINNAEIYFEDRANELDLIVVGPSGVYVVEVKNVSGTVCGSYNDKNLQQRKRDETKTLYNPVKQVSTHVDILARYLRAKGIQTWVRGVVFFVNPNCTLDLTFVPRDGVPLFAISSGGKEQLIDYLKRQVPNPLSRDDVEKIAKLI